MKPTSRALLILITAAAYTLGWAWFAQPAEAAPITVELVGSSCATGVATVTVSPMDSDDFVVISDGDDYVREIHNPNGGYPAGLTIELATGNYSWDAYSIDPWGRTWDKGDGNFEGESCPDITTTTAPPASSTTTTPASTTSTPSTTTPPPSTTSPTNPAPPTTVPTTSSTTAPPSDAPPITSAPPQSTTTVATPPTTDGSSTTQAPPSETSSTSTSSGTPSELPDTGLAFGGLVAIAAAFLLVGVVALTASRRSE